MWLVGIGGTATALAAFAQMRRHHADAAQRDTTDIVDAKHVSDDETSPPPPATTWQHVTRIVDAWVFEPIGTLCRFFVLVVLFAPVILAAPLLLIGPRPRVEGQQRGSDTAGQRWGAMLWFRLLVAQMERAGPTFIKLGQWAGSRHDLFPDELCALFARLHSNNKPHSLKYTRKQLERVFDVPFDEIFEEFDPVPVGVGAVGQVYKATLRADLVPPGYKEAKFAHPHLPDPVVRIGEQLALTYSHEGNQLAVPTSSVAIKLLHPNVRRTITRDITIMRFCASAINLLPGMKWISIPEEVDQFADLMFSQLNLLNEAKNLARFERNFADYGGTISFPRPLLDFCAPDVLVEEHIDAVPLKYFLKMGGLDYDARIADLGLDAFLKMLLLDNFTHADLHPGNIMVKFYRPTTETVVQTMLARALSRVDRDYVAPSEALGDQDQEQHVVENLLKHTDNKEAWLDTLQNMEDKGYLPELIFLDAGLVNELSPMDQRNFLDLFSALTTFDGERAGQLLVDRSRSPELALDKPGFVKKIGHIVHGVKNNTFSLANMHIGELLGEALVSVREHHVKLEPDFVDTVLSILILEGIGRRLDPDLDVRTVALLRRKANPAALPHGSAHPAQHGSAALHGRAAKRAWRRPGEWAIGPASYGQDLAVRGTPLHAHVARRLSRHCGRICAVWLAFGVASFFSVQMCICMFIPTHCRRCCPSRSCSGPRPLRRHPHRHRRRPPRPRRPGRAPALPGRRRHLHELPHPRRQRLRLRRRPSPTASQPPRPVCSSTYGYGECRGEIGVVDPIGIRCAHRRGVLVQCICISIRAVRRRARAFRRRLAGGIVRGRRLWRVARRPGGRAPRLLLWGGAGLDRVTYILRVHCSRLLIFGAGPQRRRRRSALLGAVTAGRVEQTGGYMGGSFGGARRVLARCLEAHAHTLFQVRRVPVRRHLPGAHQALEQRVVGVVVGLDTIALGTRPVLPECAAI